LRPVLRQQEKAPNALFVINCGLRTESFLASSSAATPLFTAGRTSPCSFSKMTTPVKKVPIHLQSSQNRLLIKNGTVVNADGSAKVDVFVEEGQIKQVGVHLIIPGGTKVIDATGKLVIPGGVDADVHLAKPHGKRTQVIDDFYQGTRAALIGGTTTVVDCVQVAEGEAPAEAYKKWMGWAEDKACCNYVFRMALPVGAGAGAEEAVADLAGQEYGLNSFCVDLAEADDSRLLDVFSAIRSAGALAEVRPVSSTLAKRAASALLARGVTGPEGYALAHSEALEEEATLRAATLADQVHCPLIIGPLASPAAVEAVQRRRAKGQVIYGATTPAALACDGEEYWNKCWRHAAGFVCSPPLRKGVQNAVADAAAKGPGQGGLDLLVSDHTTFNAAQKALGKDDFTEIPVGVNGTEERMSILWEKTVHGGKMSPEAFVAYTSATPAAMYNLYPQRGRIEEGSAADIVVWNPKAERTITAAGHQLKTDFNVFEGQTVHGAAETVICGGRLMVDDGQIRVMQGFGQLLLPEPHSPAVYGAVREREMESALPAAVERSAEDMAIPYSSTNGNGGENGHGDFSGPGGDVPPPTPPKPDQVPRAPSQHESHFDLRAHPNPPEAQEISPTSRNSVGRSSVRVRAPPGGRSSGGFW